MVSRPILSRDQRAGQKLTSDTGREPPQLVRTFFPPPRIAFLFSAFVNHPANLTAKTDTILQFYS